MSELAKLKQLHGVSVSSSSTPVTATVSVDQGQMMMVNSAVDPFLGPSVLPGAAVPHTSTADITSLGQCLTHFVSTLQRLVSAICVGEILNVC